METPTFNDHQAAELVFLRKQVAELRDTIEFLKLDNRELTKSYYKLIQRSHNDNNDKKEG
jgi:hypothetical protein